MATFPNVAALADGSLIATYRVGSDKDSADETVEIRRSSDSGETWTKPANPFSTVVNGRSGSLKCVYLTPLPGSHLLGCALWVDREAYPGKPLFNPDTEGCLPMAILLADSRDGGNTWTPWRTLPLPDDIGPPSLTSPVLQLRGGELAVSIETNKTYLDRSKWYQRVAYTFSGDQGHTWSAPHTVSQDPEARIFYWDQRAGVTSDGSILTLSWTYDRETNTYLNIQRRISRDSGRSWTAPCDLGFADQPSRPAILPDGRVILAWVDRYGTRSIRVRMAPGLDAEFSRETEVVLYNIEPQHSGGPEGLGQLLADMSLWTYGLPYAEALPNGDVMIVYYAGNEAGMDIRWSRLSVE